MYKDYQVVANTAAGRRRYMQWLVPYVVASDVVDRYDIWVNTHNGADIEFFKRLAAEFPKVNLVWQPDGVVGGNASINAFYKDCTDEHTIYFKLDDDIVWMEPDAIDKMVEFRVAHPQYFVVSPLVVNNSLSTYLLQVCGKLRLDQYYEASPLHPVLWESGYFAAQLHQWFIDNYADGDRSLQLHMGKKEMGMTRFSINAILWFGRDMARFGGVVPGDDEDFLSCIKPTQLGVANAWNGDAVMAHFAFFTQREQLDRQHILQQYGECCKAQWSAIPVLREVGEQVQRIMRDITAHEAELMATPSPYKALAKPKSPWWRRNLPKSVKKLFRYQLDMQQRDFIK